MKATRFSYIFLVILIAFGSSSCNKNKNTYLNRKYQDMVAHFNVYFNGTERLKDAVTSLEKSHKDDYKDILEVYPYSTDESRKSLSGQMDEVIKKASKVITDRPLSKWVDDAYLLMGKAYFFKGDYFAAIETFQFINTKYKGEKISYEATLWIIKAYVYLGKATEAEAIIGMMNNDEKFPEKLKPFLNEVAAHVYIHEKKYKLAADNLEKALPRARGSAQKARYNYILGQLYDKLGKREKARNYFKTVTKGTPPYEMAFNAKVNLARNYNPKDKGEVRAAKRYLQSMLRDDKNISFFDQIYYELGVIEKREKDFDQALENFRQSNNYNKGNADQRALSFLAMADIYFQQPNYTNAQIYYDSAVFFLKPEFENYEKLKAKQEVLTDLIKNLILIRREDSLLKVSTLSIKEIDNRIDKAIKEEKERAEKLRLEEEERAKNQARNTNPMIPGNPFQQVQTPVPAVGSFYFDDPSNVARGYSEFLNRWGRRKNVDNWQFKAIADESQALNNNNSKEGDNSESDNGDNGEKSQDLPDSIPPEKAIYYKDIPFTKEAKRASNRRIAEAYLNVGEIYFEQLKENAEARENFETYLKRYPNHEGKPKALYYLYKLNLEEEKVADADKYKSELISKFPDSEYSRYLTSSSPKVEDNNPLNKEISTLYQQCYEAHQKGNYQEVFNLKALNDSKYFGSFIQAKFELLEAVSYGKIDSIDRCIRELEQVVTSYSTEPEALTAQKMINAFKRNNAGKEMGKEDDGEQAASSYEFNPTAKHFFMLLLPETKGKLNANNIKAKINDFNKSQKSGTSFAIDDLIVGSRHFILVKEFPNAEQALAYLKLVNSNTEFLSSLGIPGHELFVMDAKNVGIMAVNSDIEGFVSFYKNYYSK